MLKTIQDFFSKFLEIQISKNYLDAYYTCIAGIIFSLVMVGTLNSLKKSISFLFATNTNLLDIYWNTIIIVLTIMIPISLEVIRLAQSRFPNFGSELYFKWIKFQKLFWILPIFGFTLFFLLILDNIFEKNLLNQNLFLYIHAWGFFLWAVFFWHILNIFYKSSTALIDNGNSLNEMFYERLRDDSKSDISENVVEKWKSLWDSIDKLREEWRRKFLFLFWNKQKEILDLNQYDKSFLLFEDFAKSFLSLKEKDVDVVVLFNDRKKWLWFYEIYYRDGEENPYSVFIRLLEFYHLSYNIRAELFASRTVADSPGVYRLYDSLKNIIEGLITNELENSDDYFYSLFKRLKEHIDQNIDNLKYIESLPIYKTIFEHANLYHLYNYRDGSNNDGFPNEWRITPSNISISFSENATDKVRFIWVKNFIDWCEVKIQNGNQKFDSNLDSSLELIFPETYKPWIALSLGYRILGWGGSSRIVSLCRWERNFGVSSVITDSFSYEIDMSEEESQRVVNERIQTKLASQKENAISVINKFSLFGNRDEIIAMNRQLSDFQTKNNKEEYTRKELLELFNHLLN